MLTAMTVCFIHGIFKNVSNDVHFFLIYWPATAAVLSLSLTLWAEEISARRRWPKIAVQALVQLAWLAGACYTSFGPLTPMRIGAAFAANVAVVMSAVLVPFWRERTDVAMWNFALRMTINVAISCVIAIMLSSAVCLLVASFDALFGVDVSQHVYADVWAVCLLFIAPLMLLQLVPQGTDKHDDTPTLLSGFGKGVVNYLLLPVTAAYALTLYAYACKIIIEWQLPNGWVSYLVTAFAALMLMVVTVLYPARMTGKCSRLHLVVSKWLPALVLPMLILMTVGVARRLSDYGITIHRLYLVVFNVWLYVVCFGLLIKRSRIWWIPASFAVILIVTSIGPQSISNVTRIILKQQVEESIAKTGFKQLPLNDRQYTQALHKLPAREALMLDSRLAYLKDYFTRDEIKGIVASDVQPGDYQDEVESGEKIAQSTHANGLLIDCVTALPQGYSYISEVSSIESKLDADGKGVITANSRNGKELKFTITKQQVTQASNDSKPFTLTSQGAALIVSDAHILAYDSTVEVSGILLEK